MLGIKCDGLSPYNLCIHEFDNNGEHVIYSHGVSGKKYKTKLITNNKGIYFVANGRRQYLDDFIRT